MYGVYGPTGIFLWLILNLNIVTKISQLYRHETSSGVLVLPTCSPCSRQ